MSQILLDHLCNTKAKGCRRCRLALHRNQLVFGSGNPENPDIVFVGEGPGSDENRAGEPFVGPAGQLLDGFLRKAKIIRENMYIMNVVQCQAPDNREPEPDEIAACSPFLHLKLKILNPKIIVALGKTAGYVLSGLPSDTPVRRMRDQDLHYSNETTGIFKPLIVTYHPSYILRTQKNNPAQAKIAAKDLLADLERALLLASVESM